MESLENSRVGDKIFYDGNSTIGISKIKRLTKTQIILTNEQRFRKRDGRSVGCDIWSTTTIKVLTPARSERVALMKLKNEATWLRNNLVIPPDREALEKLIRALKPFEKLIKALNPFIKEDL